MSRRIVPVSTLVHYLKGKIEADAVMHGVLIEGEISNLRKPYSGHWYFSLKDERSSIACVMFASANRRLTFPVNTGDKVVVRGDVTVYEAEGRTQIIVNGMQPSGIGDLYLRFEELKKKLNAEGLFDPAHKKPVPPYAMDIGIVTGNNTAAREDVLTTLKRRWPCAKITEYFAPVQGMEAAPKIIASLAEADAGGHDVIILARGGGSIEDLWCFNDENLARFIYAMKTPVISGVGHETDFTLVDYVSDLRANTPTGAAEHAVPDQSEVYAALRNASGIMKKIVGARLMQADMQYRKLSGNAVFTDPERLYREKAMRVDYLRERLNIVTQDIKDERNRLSYLSSGFNRMMYTYTSALKQRVLENETKLNAEIRYITAKKKEQLAKESAMLDAYSPLKVLARGYAIASVDGNVIREIGDVAVGDNVNVRVSGGSFDAVVSERKDMKDGR